MAPRDDEPGVADDDLTSDNLTIDVSIEGAGAVVVRIAGEIDISTADTVRAAVAGAVEREAIEPDASLLVLDMAGVDFIDSSGVTVLLQAVKLAGSFQIRSPSMAVRRIIETTGLSDVLPFSD
jgi:anti-anti-sigma factor